MQRIVRRDGAVRIDGFEMGDTVTRSGYETLKYDRADTWKPGPVLPAAGTAPNVLMPCEPR